jgi:hypothetical protein
VQYWCGAGEGHRCRRHAHVSLCNGGLGPRAAARQTRSTGMARAAELRLAAKDWACCPGVAHSLTRGHAARGVGVSRAAAAHESARRTCRLGNVQSASSTRVSALQLRSSHISRAQSSNACSKKRGRHARDARRLLERRSATELSWASGRGGRGGGGGVSSGLSGSTWTRGGFAGHPASADSYSAAAEAG